MDQGELVVTEEDLVLGQKKPSNIEVWVELEELSKEAKGITMRNWRGKE